MCQTLLLPGCDAKDRWRPIVSLFRPRLIAGIVRRKPLPGQLSLPGMGLTEGARETALPTDEDDLAPSEEPSGGAAGSQPTCPNCGDTEFDEDGDCTSCWEPAVVRPVGGRESA